jgi:hypothetical protein
MNVTVILGYGVFTEDNLQYKAYLDSVLTLLKSLYSDKVVVTGSMTNSEHPGKEEAMSQKEYLVKQSSQLENKILLENQSLSTPQNLEFSLKLLKQQNIDISKLDVICDSIRSPKVFYLSCFFFNALLKLNISEEGVYSQLFNQLVDKNIDITKDSLFSYKNLVIHGVNLHRDPSEIGLQVTSSMLEVGFTKYPELEKQFLVWRRKKFGMTTQ